MPYTARGRAGRKGALDPAGAGAIVRTAAEALAAARERRIVHRQVTPDHVLVSVSSQEKLTDPGLAKALEQELGEPTARR